MEIGVKASDVLLQNTVAKVEDLLERTRAVDGDLQMKAPLDYWKPQMNACIRGLQMQEAKVSMLDKEMNARFSQESAQRDRAKAQMQDNMKACLEKISPSKPAGSRFIEVAEEPAMEPRVPMPHPGAASVSVPTGRVVRQMSAAPGYASPHAPGTPIPITVAPSTTVMVASPRIGRGHSF